MSIDELAQTKKKVVGGTRHWYVTTTSGKIHQGIPRLDGEIQQNKGRDGSSYEEELFMRGISERNIIG